MRYFGLHGFKVETAGQSSPTGGSLVNIVGIVDTKGFRKAVLEQRDRVSSVPNAVSAIPASTGLGTSESQSQVTAELLTDIRDSLHRIEQNISNTSS